MRWWALALCLAGCGFHAEGGGDLGAPDGGADRAVPDGGIDAGLDGGTLDGGASCPLPELLVAVTNSQSGGHGEILRLPLSGGPDGGCPPLTGGGTIEPTVHVVAWIPPGSVAAAGEANLVVIDADTDRLRFQQAIGAPGDVIDLFPLVTSETLVGEAINVTSPSYQIDRVRAYRDGNAPVYNWLLNGTDQPIGNVFGVTARPDAPGHLLALVVSTTPSGATDFDPIAKTTAPYATYPSGAMLTTIAAVEAGGLLRIAWRDDNAGPGLRAVRDDGSGPAAVGPLSCPSCAMNDAVPDPTDPDGYFAICDSMLVVHVSAVSSGCPTVVDASTLPLGFDHFTRLAIAN